MFGPVPVSLSFFFLNYTTSTEIYTLTYHAALAIFTVVLSTSSIAVTVPTLMFWPATAGPVFVQVMLAPTASVVAPHPIAPSLSSVTATLESDTFPLFETVYVHVTVDPTGTTGPVPV